MVKRVAWLGAAVLVAGAPGASAQVACGDTIGPGQKAALTGDLGPCAGPGAALTVIGPATLDLAGFSVDCGFFEGIRLEGQGAKLLRGVVRNGNPALVLTGEGRHSVVSVLARGGTDGFHVLADKNKLVRATSSDSDGDQGFLVSGNGNRLQQAAAIDGSIGFVVDGDGNRLEGPRAADNSGQGVVLSGNGNRLVGATVSFNEVDGILVTGNENRVERGFVTENGPFGGAEAGIEVTGDSNRIRDNEVVNDPSFGILVEGGAQGNLLTGNLSLGHEVPEGFDLRDENGAGCGGNTWFGNVFGTSDPAKASGSGCIE